ncbi:unnamed protein product [Mytilus coruscus]|uniref:Uncharacterized protein n=1 Tax=Mytilus coruscus TaxID=42192 RepID=A0A6J8BJS0_MYTCO|nr:unnamed protein product [Mytilus coruscus]
MRNGERLRLCCATLHYNENCNREMATSKDGMQCLSMVYLNAKKGKEAVVESRQTPASYDYVLVIKQAVIIGTVLRSVYTSQIKWKLATKPAVLGLDIDLKCSLDSNTSIDGTRQWSKGQNLTLLVLNGTPVNRTKYTEKLQKARLISVLTIRSLSVEDVNVPYTCQLGFDTYTDILNMTVENFEYHSEGQISCLRFKDDHAIFSLKFRKVFPIPNCTASTGVNVSLRYHHVRKKHIDRSLDIVCCAGTKRIEYSLQFNNDNCTDEVSKVDGKGSALSQIEVLGIAVICLVCLLPCTCLCIFLWDNKNVEKFSSSTKKLFNILRSQKKRQERNEERDDFI